jgi:hypothetical protein
LFAYWFVVQHELETEELKYLAVDAATNVENKDVRKSMADPY